ncbi:MAG: formimidoylglutamate deiminase, partial [Kiloniellales bacterium]|nr:formimidoylglutamate deiminase [Kiloniellales bacterium]
MTTTRYFADHALLPQGWARDVILEVGDDGALAAVQANAPSSSSSGSARPLKGPVLPGMPNLHSHAFQRAMAGLTERARVGAENGGNGADGREDSGEDSFWTWREVMYGFVRQLEPGQVQAIAAQLYVEMLEAGYTAVGEFHYLHHDREGAPYDDPAEMSRRVIAAAKATGIGLTHLPVLYGYGGFGGQPAGEGQRRFLNRPERYLDIVARIHQTVRDDPQLHLGIAPHSLRAVTPETLTAALQGIDELDEAAPVHIHVAEQQPEVRDCIDWSGLRPVEWLLTHEDLGPRWCLVHATHMTDEEAVALAKTGAVAGLCPTTEANLGDGVFPAGAYLEAGGKIGIGSDSHISVSPVEELRWLEYSQRLTLRRRNLLAGDRGAGDSPSVGARLVKAALDGGARALGRPIGRLAP